MIGNIGYIIIGRVFALEKSIDKGKVACFSGYRPHKFDFKLVGDEYKKFTTQLYNEIVKAIEGGFTVFIVGCAPGMDIISAELVIVAKEQYPDKEIKLICALPYSDFKNSKHFNPHWQKRYDNVMAHCDETVNVTNNHNWSKRCYSQRNEYMIDNSSLLICYSTGKAGGTETTIRYAVYKGITIVNIATKI